MSWCGCALTACLNSNWRWSGFGVAFFFSQKCVASCVSKTKLTISAFKSACQEIKLYVVVLVAFYCGIRACTQLQPWGFLSLLFLAAKCLCALEVKEEGSLETVSSASRALARSLAAQCREVLRALDTSCCHRSTSLKRYLANLISYPKNRPGSYLHSR